KGKTGDVRSIGNALSVGSVLEGGVQRSGATVRITAQLINAQTGYHIWSEKYDRDAKDLFAVEDEISRAIAEQLRLKLVVGAILATQATSSVNAHDLYLLGLQQWSQRTPESLHKGVDYFTRATQADSTYAQAWAGLALGWAVLPQYDAAVPALPSFQKGQEAAQRALKLEPRSAEANAALG